MRSTGTTEPAAALGRVALVALSLLAAGGCGGDNDHVTNPAPAFPGMAEMWPNEDGRSWDYLATYRTWAPPGLVIYASEALVPPVTFDSVSVALAARPAGAGPVEAVRAAHLQFNGTTTLASGITAQVLSETSTSLPGVRRAGPRASLGLSATGRFLHGGLWRRTASSIGTYDPTELDTLVDWQFLDANLTPGHTFELQILPELAPELKLHARVVRRLIVETPSGSVANGIEVHYFLDFGISTVTDDSGNPIGFARGFDCGSVLYAPGVGPVRDDERYSLSAGACRRPGAADLLLQLTATGPPALQP